MIKYYIQTPTGKEGPFSVEQLKKKAVSSETLICTEGGRWIPACKFEALKTILNETGAPSHFTKHVGPRYVFSADAISEPKTRSRISFMQWASIVLLILNGALYYYKQDDNPTSRREEQAKAAPVPMKLVAAAPAEQRLAQPAKPDVPKVDTTNNHIRNNWSTFIKASHNAFRFYSKLGGIHHLKAVVHNNTDFPLDTVQVSIRYIRRGETYKTEYVNLYNVPEQGELAVSAPNSRSGTSVELNITKVSSVQLNLFYSADSLGASGAPLRM